MPDRVPSPALVIAVIALVVAVGGGTFAIASSDSKQDKKIAKKVVRKAPPILSVLHAKTADQAATAATATRADTARNADSLGGAPASAYEPKAQWALVSKEGTILAQSGGITINTALAGNGLYFLDFGRSVGNRPVSVVPHYGDGGLTGDASATPCGAGAVPGGFDCTNTSGVNDANHLLVRMQSSTGTDEPFGFYVTVGG
jgi:hypothetical protein